MNAKDEIITIVNIRGKLKCARVILGADYAEDSERKCVDLRVGHSTFDYANFLHKLDFVYDNGFGSQELFGILWFEGGTWAARVEYDGSEWWGFHSLPPIPLDLLEILKK